MALPVLVRGALGELSRSIRFPSDDMVAAILLQSGQVQRLVDGGNGNWCRSSQDSGRSKAGGDVWMRTNGKKKGQIRIFVGVAEAAERREAAVEYDASLSYDEVVARHC